LSVNSLDWVPANRQEANYRYMQIGELQTRLQERLESAPAFRYAFSGEIKESDLNYLLTNSNREYYIATYNYLISSNPSNQFSVPIFVHLLKLGFLLSETLWQQVGAPSNFEPLMRGYVWLPPAPSLIWGGVQLPPHEVKYEEGSNLLNSRQYAAALDVFNDLTQFMPEFDKAFYCKGLALGNLGRHEEALAAFEAALRLNPTFDKVYNNRDSALYNLGRLEEALESYNTLLASNPDYAYGYFRKGILLDGLEHYDAALESLNKSIELEPNFAPAHHSKGIVLDHLGRSIEALQVLEESLRLEPNSPQVLNSWRIVMKKLGGSV
jgi:tetratricopeptide (TPR) repeat protein